MAAYEMNSAQAAGVTVSLCPPAFFESRMWTVVEVVAISTQFEPSPLYVDFRQEVCTTSSFQSSCAQRFMKSRDSVQLRAQEPMRSSTARYLLS